MILGRKTGEIDFVAVGDAPALALETCRRLNGHGFVVYEKFGTASFLLDGRQFEFVTARAETYHVDSRNPEVRQSSLDDDLRRRDFTVNALAMKVNRKGFGDIFDPFNGRRDIKRRLIRTPLDPERTFSDDPLRIMRAARFAGQLNFHIAPETLAAMAGEKERLKIVSQERITAELLKILSHPKPSIGLRILQDTGVMEIIFPELAHLSGVEQRDDYHHKDVFAHTLKVVDNAAAISDDILLRFTALVHDLGKPAVKRFEEGLGWTFHSHELVGERMLNGICRRLKLSNEFKHYSKKLTRLHMRPIQLIGEEVTDSAVRRLLVQAGDDVEALMTLCRADITSGNPGRVKKHLANFDHVVQRMQEVEEKDKMRAFQSPVRGDEIMRICGLEPGPAVGRIKNRIEEAILDGTIPNEYDAAMAYLHEIKDQYSPPH
ncbi:HD domain-containing protein [bacterium]|nr:HD domain-containing protein [bacterium]